MNNLLKKHVKPRDILFWNVLGSLASAGISTILLLVVSRTLSGQSSDNFSIAYAIGNLLITIGTFQVRDFQATDIREKYQFSTYFYTRILTVFLMLVAGLANIWVNGYEFEKALSVFLVVFYRATDAFSEVYQGYFQQHERLDIAGRSLFYRNALIAVAFTIFLMVTGNLTESLIGIIVVSIAFILWFDVRIFTKTKEKIERVKGQSIVQLMKDSFPLFLNGYLLVSIYNQPKYAIDDFLENGSLAEGAQRDFNVIFMPIFSLNLLMIFFRPLTTQLAIYKEKGMMAEFKGLQKKIFSYLAIFSALIFVGLHLLGIPLLSLIYGLDLSSYQTSFSILMVGGILSTFATLIDNVLIVLRKQHFIVLSFLLAFVVSLLTSHTLVEEMGVFGAALSFTIAMLTWFTASLVVYVFNGKEI